jgi:hypothetical protein
MKKATIFQKVFLALFLGGVVFSLLNTLPSCTVGSHLPRPLLIEKYGPLVKDPAGVFDLPEGFTYKVISQTGDLMSDGLLVPDRPDGMATFEGSRGRVILIRNHELMPSHPGPFGTDGALAANVPKEKIYDLGDGDSLICPGGTSTLIINEESLEVENLSSALPAHSTTAREDQPHGAPGSVVRRYSSPKAMTSIRKTTATTLKYRPQKKSVWLPLFP